MRSVGCSRRAVRPRAARPGRLAGRCVTAAVLFALLTGSAVAARGDVKDGRPWWPHFHGPQRDNVSRETGLLRKWPQGGPTLLWKAGECGVGFSGVALAEGKIFTAGDFDDVEKVLALDMDGRLRWQSPNGESWTGPYPGSRTTPSYCAGMV